MVGGALGTGSAQVAVMRLNPDYLLDKTFNGNGIVISKAARVAIGRAVANQPNGQILIGGEAIPSSTADHPKVIGAARRSRVG